MTGEPLASGRAADVYVDAPGRVRRRYRRERDCAPEAAIMRHARSGGFPVPEVFAVCGGEIVMERVDGPSMLDDLVRRPWRLRSHARLLADLHRRLHRLPAPPWLDSPFGEGRALLHLDLHPGNVIVAPAGPCVIDWTDATAGPPEADVAQTWILLASSVVPGPPWQRAIAAAGRRLFLGAFLRQFDRTQLVPYLPALARARLDDENVRDVERRAVARIVQRVE
jgi:aminoglycoside phosphotransferase (APT) family kinase protein